MTNVILTVSIHSDWWTSTKYYIDASDGDIHYTVTLITPPYEMENTGSCSITDDISTVLL